MPEIQEILTDLVIESVKKYIDPMTKLELPTLSVQTAIKTAAEQIEQQQRERVEKLELGCETAKEAFEKINDMQATIIRSNGYLIEALKAALKELETTDA